MVPDISALLLLLASLGLFAWVGFRQRGGLDVEDYVIARSSQGAQALGLSFFASGLGAWILFAPPEVGAGVGLVAVAGYGLGAAAPILAFAPLGKRLRRVAPGGHSLPEFVRLRFGPVFAAYIVVLSVLYMGVFLTAELTAVGGVTAILSGLSPDFAIVLVAGVTLAYTAYGGLRASMRTDRLQAWLILGLLAVAAGALFSSVPNPGNTAATALTPHLDRLGIEVAVTLILAVAAANMFHQGYWQRVWAATDDRALSRGALLGGLASIPVVLVVGVLGIVAVTAGVDVGSPPVPLFALIADTAPWIAAVAFTLGVALVASSVDTLENALAGLVVAERPKVSLGGARLLTIGLMVPALAVALQGHSVLRLFLIADLLCATAVIPALLGLWPRANTAGAMAGAVAGLLGAILPGWWSTGSFTQGIRLATFPDIVPTLGPFFWALVCSGVVAVVVSLAQRQSADLDRVSAGISRLGR